MIDTINSVATKNTLAGAVAREINRIVMTGEHHGEGSAYKAEFERRGSGYEKHIYAAAIDAGGMSGSAQSLANGVIVRQDLAGCVK